MSYTPESLIEAVRYFSDLRVCNEYMRGIKWGGKEPACPRCQSGDVYELSTHPVFHLQRYVDEEVFRFNARKGNDAERFAAVMSRVPGRRITWRKLCEVDGCGYMGLQ